MHRLFPVHSTDGGQWEAANIGELAQKAGRAYADLVAAGKDVALWHDHLRQQMYLGDDAFVLRRMQALASDRAMSNKAIPKAQRASPKTLQDWLDAMPSRDEAIVDIPAFAVEPVGHCAAAGLVGAVGEPDRGSGAGLLSMKSPAERVYRSRAP